MLSAPDASGRTLLLADQPRPRMYLRRKHALHPKLFFRIPPGLCFARLSLSTPFCSRCPVLCVQQRGSAAVFERSAVIAPLFWKPPFQVSKIVCSLSRSNTHVNAGRGSAALSPRLYRVHRCNAQRALLGGTRSSFVPLRTELTSRRGGSGGGVQP